MEILGDDEAALPEPPPRRWPAAPPEEVATFGAAVDVTPPAPTNGAARDVDPAVAFEQRHGPTDDGHRPTDDGHRPTDDPKGPESGRLRSLLDTVAGPESLGVCGVLTALAGATTSGLSPIVVAFRPEFLGSEGDTAASIAEAYATMLAVFGVVALVLGVGGVLRLRPRSAAWARALTGAAVLLGVLLLLVSAWAIWRAGSLPGATDVTGGA